MSTKDVVSTETNHFCCLGQSFEKLKHFNDFYDSPLTVHRSPFNDLTSSLIP